MGSQAIHIQNKTTPVKKAMTAKTVTLAGTAEPLSASSVVFEEVLIQAKQSNTSRVYIGTSTVANDDSNGICLYPSDTLRLHSDDLSEWYIDSIVNGEGVTITYWYI